MHDSDHPPRRRTNGRPVIGMLFGVQVYGTGMIYGFVDSLTRGVRAAARDRGCDLMLACGINPLNLMTPRPAWPLSGPHTDFVPVGPWNTDGLLVVHPLLSEERSEHIRALKASGFPIVYVGTAEGGPAIHLDNDSGINQALTHLVAQHQHRRIAFIAGYPNDTDGDSGERLAAFHATSRALGLEPDPRLIAYGNHNLVEGRQAMQKILTSHVPFTAVLASNDESAMGAVQALADAGLRVPQDVAVVGFDDLHEGASKLPPLTTVHHPVFERGYRAAELLLDCLEDRRRYDDKIIVRVPTRLVVRRSCGCTLNDALAHVVATGPAVSDERASLESRMSQTVADAVLTETQQVNSGEVHEMSRRLVHALLTSFDQGNDDEFLCAVQSVLARVEQSDGNVQIWELALGVLAQTPELKNLPQAINRGDLTIAALLERAGRAIAESLQRRRWHERYYVSEESGLMVARLLLARSEPQILRILAEHMPHIGVRRAAVALFEPDTDDPVAGSVMRTSMDPDGKPLRFATRSFPPPEFACAADTASSMVLVPILIQQERSGFMALDADNLELCAGITHAVDIALKGVAMYREATEGRRAAEEANRLKSRLLSAVSHELRTPLSMILASSEQVLAKKEIRDSGDRNLVRIRASAQHLDGLIRDVLDLAQDEIGQLKLTQEPLDLAAALEPVIVVGEELARTRGLDWHLEIPPQLPKVWADRARLRQVALNLVTNAVKFTGTGGVTLRVERGDKTVTVSVSDTGLGVPVDEQEMIFHDFHQSQRTSTRGYTGLGLGLAICKRLVEMHAGEIGVRSDGAEGSGSTFFFTLPVLEVDLDTVEQSLSREHAVFLLDDQTGGARELHARLTQHGFSVQRVRVEDLAASLDMLSARQPRTVLMDARLAGGRGWEIVRQLKDNPVTRAVPILMYSLMPDRDQGTVLTLDYLTKPVGTAELAQVFQRQGITDDERARTVLVADDDPGLLEMHAEIVQNLPAVKRILTARNGKEALELIQRERPDLVLLDLIMPEMDGFEVLDAMQALETTRHIPVIVLTGQTLADDEMARLNRGVAAVLGKGVFTVEETLGHIQQTLDRAQHARSDVQRLVRKAMAYMHRHHARALTRNEIARQVHVSDDHLTRCFQMELHMPPMTYLTRYRINKAKALLASGREGVAEVAASVGFPNEFYFSRVFRREVGITPSAYRRGRRSL